MSHLKLSGKRILVTHADLFMGPALCEVLAEQGAEVIASKDALATSTEVKQLIDNAGGLDVVLVNLGVAAPSTPATEVTDSEWQQVFGALVDPLPRIIREVLPPMVERRSGKILLMGSASALRGIKRASTYSAARGAQLAYIQSVGVEVAAHNVQVNAIAQNFVDNATYFPPEVQQNPRFQERLKREVPLGRLVSAREDAEFAAFLCSDAADCFVGQVFPVAGGWVTR